MTGLLDQRRIENLNEVAMTRVRAKVELVRGMMFSKGADSAPPGFVNLDTPDKVRIFTRYVSRQANREQAGVVPGNLHQTVAENPDVQMMAVEAQQQEAQQQEMQQ